MRKIAKIALISAILAVTACGNSTEQQEQYEQPTEIATEPIPADEQNEPNQTVQAEPPTTPIAATTIPFTVNGTADFQLTAFLPYNQSQNQ
ncbi:MAG: hypothetical protein FWG65_00255, partial [Turicibacter sp.]|nr:hypothetical protein [Turicibacter sp.]